MNENCKVILEIYSDSICPWCWIGKRRLQKAIELIEEPLNIETSWLAFQLNPDMPEEGMDRKEYRSRKFGSWEYSQGLDAEVEKAGLADGLHFYHDRMKKTPNTFASHRLISFAKGEDKQSEMVEAILEGYFSRGLDIGDKQVLASLADEVGLNEKQVAEFLSSSKGIDSVRAEINNARQHGISGVPTIIVNGTPLLSGAQAPERLARKITQLAHSQNNQHLPLND